MQKHLATKNTGGWIPDGFARLLAPILLAAVLPQSSIAQDGNNVTLRFANGQDSIDGLLQDFEDNKFIISTSIGLIAVPNNGVDCIGNACPEGTGLEIENAQIVLTSKDGSVTIEGDLIEVADDEYVLATAFGEQRVAVGLVDCAGNGCIGNDDPAEDSIVILEDANGLAPGEVELFNGAIKLVGELLDVRDGSFIIKDRMMGEVRVSMTDFDCTGPGCPN